MEIKRRSFSEEQLRYACMMDITGNYGAFIPSTNRPHIEKIISNQKVKNPYKQIRKYIIIKLTALDINTDVYSFRDLPTEQIIKFLKNKGINVDYMFKLSSRDFYVQIKKDLIDAIYIRAISKEDLEDLTLTKEESELYDRLITKEKAQNLFNDLYLEIFNNALKPLHLEIITDNGIGEIRFSRESAENFIEDLKAKCNKFGLSLNNENSMPISWNISNTEILRFEISKLDFIEKCLKEVK